MTGRRIVDALGDILPAGNAVEHSGELSTCSTGGRVLVPGSWIGALLTFSLFLPAPHMVLTQDPSTNAHLTARQHEPAPRQMCHLARGDAWRYS